MEMVEKERTEAVQGRRKRVRGKKRRGGASAEEIEAKEEEEEV